MLNLDPTFFRLQNPIFLRSISSNSPLDEAAGGGSGSADHQTANHRTVAESLSLSDVPPFMQVPVLMSGLVQMPDIAEDSANKPNLSPLEIVYANLMPAFFLSGLMSMPDEGPISLEQRTHTVRLPDFKPRKGIQDLGQDYSDDSPQAITRRFKEIQALQSHAQKGFYESVANITPRERELLFEIFSENAEEDGVSPRAHKEVAVTPAMAELIESSDLALISPKARKFLVEVFILQERLLKAGLISKDDEQFIKPEFPLSGWDMKKLYKKANYLAEISRDVQSMRDLSMITEDQAKSLRSHVGYSNEAQYLERQKRFLHVLAYLIAEAKSKEQVFDPILIERLFQASANLTRQERDGIASHTNITREVLKIDPGDYIRFQNLGGKILRIMSEPNHNHTYESALVLAKQQRQHELDERKKKL
jgi:hypothetical protein